MLEYFFDIDIIFYTAKITFYLEIRHKQWKNGSYGIWSDGSYERRQHSIGLVLIHDTHHDVNVELLNIIAEI